MDPFGELEDSRSDGMNFIPCVAWVKRGAAKPDPDKVRLTEDELAAVIQQTRGALEELEMGDDEEGEEVDAEAEAEAVGGGGDNVMEKYGLNDYDEEGGENDPESGGLGIGNLVTFADPGDDPYLDKDKDDDDSDADDFKIRPTDNLIVCGHVEGDASILEVYVYNDVEDALYVHHDILLPSFPLTLECVGVDRGEEGGGGKANLVAVGSMSPVIDVWDLDLVNSLEPEFRLGKKAKKKKKGKKEGYGHKDAVLSLAWNSQVEHVLASGSVDRTVHIWDLHTAKIASTLTAHTEKVQALQWHPFESQNLLSGCCDKYVRLFNCLSSDEFKQYKVDGEVERVLWNHFNPLTFLVGTDTGTVQMFDARQEDKPVWTLHAHSEGVNGMSLSSQCPDCLVTGSSDRTVKVWDIAGNRPACVHEQDMKVGTVHSLAGCPDAPFVTVIGGDKPSNNIKVFDVREWSAVRSRFGGRKLSNPLKFAAFGHETADDAEPPPANEVNMAEEKEEETVATRSSGGAAGKFRKKGKKLKKKKAEFLKFLVSER